MLGKFCCDFKLLALHDQLETIGTVIPPKSQSAFQAFAGFQGAAT
jgi:hypothetical protein